MGRQVLLNALSVVFATLRSVGVLIPLALAALIVDHEVPMPLDDFRAQVGKQVIRDAFRRLAKAAPLGVPNLILFAAAVLAVACGAVVAATRGVNTAKKKLHLPDGPAPAPKEP